MSKLYAGNSPIVITGIAPVCRHAITIAELKRANAVLQSDANVPDTDDWFDPTRYLGTRGYKYWTQATRYIQAATGLALEDAGLSSNPYEPDEIGVSFGTNFANANLIKEMDQIARMEGPERLSPMVGPNFSINIPASLVSIKYGFKAYNITLTTAMVAGLEALLCAGNSLRTGRAKLVLAGALEDTPPQPTNELLGNEQGYGGACVFVLETLNEAVKRGARIYAQLGRGAIRFVNPDLAAISEQSAWVKSILNEMVESILPSLPKRIQLWPLSYPLLFNQKINRYLGEVLTAKNIEVQTRYYIGANGAYATVSAMLQMAMGLTEVNEGLVFATSPQGHMVALALHALEGGPEEEANF
jgi:hypothetical protein